jgi:uncharacterized protein YbjT (DUF2867 family)
MTTHLHHVSSPPILVVGATGKTGRRVAERLIAANVPVRLATRAGPVRFDWDDERTLAPALTGSHAIYLTVAPDLAVPGAAELAGRFAELAADSGVHRLVLLSGRGEPGARAGEEAVQAAGVPWTIIRSACFAQDFSESFLLDAVRNGVIMLPAGDVREPFIDAEDIADLAAAALTQPGHDGRLYEVTGPQLLGFADAAAELSVATGRQIIYQPLSLTDYLAEGRRLGFAEELLAVYSHLFTETLDGRNAWISHGIQRGLRRSPRSFAAYARRTAGTGVWQVAA